MTKDVTGAEIVKVVKMARERDEPKKPPKRLNLIGFRTDQVQGAERIRNWLAGLKVKF